MIAKLTREQIAQRAARELEDGQYVNLGTGMPVLIVQFIPAGWEVILHAENGMMGYGPIDDPAEAHPDLISAGSTFVKPLPGASYFDSATAFGMIRGGHIDVSIMGGLQVSERGDLANWAIPGRTLGGVGGAMDLVAGARRLIILMEHVAKDGVPKIVRECSYPLTGKQVVDLVITDIAVIEITPEGLVLREVAPGWTPEAVQELTEPRLIVAPDLREIDTNSAGSKADR